MRFVAALNTWIFGTYYVQGSEVDTSWWTRKMILQFLGNGIIQASYLTAGSITDKLQIEGPGVSTEVNGEGKIVVTIEPPAVPDLGDLGDVSTAGADHGEALVYNSTLGRWEPGAASGGGGGGASDLRWSVPAGATPVDEFETATLDGAWVRVDASGGAGRVAWLPGGGALTSQQLGTGTDAVAELHALMRPIGTPMAVGDAFVTCLRLWPEYDKTHTMAGIVLANGVTYGSGTQVFTMSHTTANSTLQSNYVRRHTGYNVEVAPQGTALATHVGYPTFVRLVCTAANTWRMDWSMNGVAWRIGTTLGVTVTPTHVGLFQSSWGGANIRGMADYAFLRRYAGVS